MNVGSKSIPFQSSTDIPSLAGKVIVVTGGNIGLGKQCVLEYARHKPAQIWLAARDTGKAKLAVEEIQSDRPAPIRILEINLSSFESVKKAAETLLAETERLDILMLNAGVMAVPPAVTEQGYELQFGTNYLGHALLARLLLPVLEKTSSLPGADVRIIALSSYGHVYAPQPAGIEFETLKTPADELGPFGRYSQSKLAAILWTKQMAKLYPQFTLASIHPGVVRTNLMNNATGSWCVVQVLGKIAGYVVASVEQGARNQLWASVSEHVKSGEYYEPVGIRGKESDHGKDEQLAVKLWEWTEKEFEMHTGT
ncbi:NAD(P)-binding protein [Pleomassaria siparia CBS 279.74]|uniref:NAD(P)-binding protein n=1 Tax=Pleomassaria siparia CBS 279.74 TaxID=1314801 RepID=A0A6G1KP30_9PLEO|nr:NAD(P)-binding protein [Pleomassaria siparia CBS 279.74]